jgi:hypothetical protein
MESKFLRRFIALCRRAERASSASAGFAMGVGVGVIGAILVSTFLIKTLGLAVVAVLTTFHFTTVR